MAFRENAHNTLTHTHDLGCTNTSIPEQHQAFERAEQRRAAETAEMAFREDAHKRQAYHLAEVAALNREVRMLML